MRATFIYGAGDVRVIIAVVAAHGGTAAMSDQFAAVAVTMGECLGSDDARCSTQIA